MYWSFAKKKPREWVHDALSLKSQGILRLHILWLLRLQITFHVRPVALFTLVQCPVRWCSMVLTMSRERYRFEHSLRSYLWYRTLTFHTLSPNHLVTTLLTPLSRDRWLGHNTQPVSADVPHPQVPLRI